MKKIFNYFIFVLIVSVVLLIGVNVPIRTQQELPTAETWVVYSVQPEPKRESSDTGALFTLPAIDPAKPIYDFPPNDTPPDDYMAYPTAAVKSGVAGNEPLSDETAQQRPIYKVYKNGYPVSTDIYIDGEHIQRVIRRLAEAHGYDERLIIGLILAESTFTADADCGGCLGLAQITAYWLRSKAVEPYRLTSDYRDRDLLNPGDNLLTLMEIWDYARNAYGIDVSTEAGVIKLLYWHNTGNDPTHATQWAYATRIIGYMGELEMIEGID